MDVSRRENVVRLPEHLVDNEPNLFGRGVHLLERTVRGDFDPRNRAPFGVDLERGLLEHLLTAHDRDPHGPTLRARAKRPQKLREVGAHVRELLIGLAVDLAHRNPDPTGVPVGVGLRGGHRHLDANHDRHPRTTASTSSA